MKINCFSTRYKPLNATLFGNILKSHYYSQITFKNKSLPEELSNISFKPQPRRKVDEQFNTFLMSSKRR